MPTNWINTTPVMPPVISPFSYVTSGMAWKNATAANFNSSAAVSSSNIYLCPLYVTEPYRVQRFWVATGATVTGNVDMALYDENGTRLVSTGSVALSASTVQRMNVDYTIAPGRYFMALAVTAATNLAVIATQLATATRLPTTGWAMAYTVGTAVPLPASITIGSNLAYSVPIFGIARQTVF